MMTNNEKAEFERQKQRAEKQLNEMYYGKQKTKQPQTLKMPDFLSPAEKSSSPQGKNPKKEDNKLNKSPQNQTIKPEKPNQNTTGINLLNMLNLKNLTLDSDRLTVLALCLLLSSEEVDELLLLALVYIML